MYVTVFISHIRDLPPCNAVPQHIAPPVPVISQCNFIFLPAPLCTLPGAYCKMEDSIRLYFSIAAAGHCQRKFSRWCQMWDGVIVTLTHDLMVWAISPRPRPLPDDAQHLKETEFHAHKWNSYPQYHQAKHRNLPFRFIRTTEISLSYSSASISCLLSGLI